MAGLYKSELWCPNKECREGRSVRKYDAFTILTVSLPPLLVPRLQTGKSAVFLDFRTKRSETLELFLAQ